MLSLLNTASSTSNTPLSPSLLDALRTALAACLEGQPSMMQRSPAECALHEMLADAMLQQGAGGSGEHGGGRGLGLLHMVLGTFVRRWLER